jgi:hypothetical protein
MNDPRKPDITRKSLVRPILVTMTVLLFLFTGYVVGYVHLGQAREYDDGGKQPRGIPSLLKIHRIYPYRWAPVVFAPAAIVESELGHRSVSLYFNKDAEMIEAIYGAQRRGPK